MEIDGGKRNGGKYCTLCLWEASIIRTIAFLANRGVFEEHVQLEGKSLEDKWP